MKIYFLGICGTAMGNAAQLAREVGHEVMGADTGVYPPMSDVLREAGIQVMEGYSAERLAKLKPDIVVVGNAMSRGNEEIEWLLNTRALRYVSLPEILRELVLNKRKNIVVCGTHGKTTTTSLTAYLLRENGRDPGFLIGGVPIDPPMGNHLGSANDPFVIEGDEYDSAFFDKRSKFIHYAPTVAVLNNLEFDHADIFRDLADVKRTFSHLLRIVPGNGWVVMNGDDENLRSLGATPWTRTVKVGCAVGNDVRICDFKEARGAVSFRLEWLGKSWAQIVWRMNGLFNVRNAAMASVAAQLSIADVSLSLEEIAASLVSKDGKVPMLDLNVLSRFRGVKRRQEVLVDREGLLVIEDFGHHPTAIAETLKSFRSQHEGARLIAVFEPRSNTARTRTLQADFEKALLLADEVYIGAVNRAERLKDDERFDADAVVKGLRNSGKTAFDSRTNHELLDCLLKQLSLSKRGVAQVVIFFSNGSFDGIMKEFARKI